MGWIHQRTLEPLDDIRERGSEMYGQSPPRASWRESRQEAEAARWEKIKCKGVLKSDGKNQLQDGFWNKHWAVLTKIET